MSTLVRYPLTRERPGIVARPWIARLTPVPPPAYPVFVQQATGSSGAASTTIAATFGAAPTTGNLLVFAMAGDKNTGALTLTGWTIETDLLSTSVSLYLAWKVSDGTETTVNASWATSSAAGNTCWVGEYSQSGADPWTLLGSATNITDETTVTTKTTGTTASVAADAIAIALGGVDSSTSVTTVDAWGNSYAERYSATGFSGRGAVFVAELPTVSGTQSSTFNFTGTADQTSGRIGVWARAAGGGGFTVDQTDSAGLTDALAVEQQLVRTDNVGLTDPVALTQDHSVTDQTGLTDGSTQELVKAVDRTDLTGLTDTVALTFDWSRTDQTGLTDTQLIIQEKGVTDQTGLTDGTVQELIKLVQTTDVVGLTDLPSTVASYVRDVTNAAGLADIAAAAVTFDRSAVDAAGLTDSVVTELVKLVTQLDDVGLVDAATIVATYERVFTDLAGLVDSFITEGVIPPPGWHLPIVSSTTPARHSSQTESGTYTSSTTREVL